MSANAVPGADPLVVSTARDIFGDLAASDADGTAAWTALRASGLPWVGIDEAAGGEGGSLADAAAVIAVSARHPLPVPFAENWVAARLLADAGLTVPRGAQAGPLTAAVDFTRVPYAGAASGIVTVVDGSLVLFALDAAAITAGRALSDEPRDAVPVDGSPEQSAPVAGPGLVPLGALVRCVQIAAVLDMTLALTTRYAGQRTQFGRPIAKFQAVGQLIAQLAEQAAAAQLAADLAVTSAQSGDHSQVAVAKSVCGIAAGLAARYAHQVHGAVGVTAGYELHTHTRRLLTWRDDFDAERAWETRIGAHVSGLAAADLWRVVVGELPATG